jgi:hypothetical protein
MKYLIVVCCFFIIACTSNQATKVDIDAVRDEVHSLRYELQTINQQLFLLQQKQGSSTGIAQPQDLTLPLTQPDHYNPLTPSALTSNHVSDNKADSVGTTKSGQTIHEGPRGGLYHYSKSGNKVYEKKK